ncbi:MAG: CDP-6-deoxy-delta-3,4-glucoseen reductase [Gammaproteobacteria bacterium]|jgi:CDP-4-dehydro-6-deoxyglucose reductase
MSFTITIQPSGHQFDCEDDETVLDAALRQGFSLPYGCRNGACGSCMAGLLEGEVDYGGQNPPALTEADAAAGRALLCQAMPLTDLEIEVKEVGAAKDIVIKTLPVRVVGLERANQDVMIMKLKLPATERLQFLAGQYIDILLKDGRRRSFSLANAPHEDEHLVLHLRHVPGGHFTDFVFNEMKEKALLRIEGPLGTFFLREDSDRPAILVAGGTGLAPMRSILMHAFAADMQRPFHLYWGVRGREDLYLDEEVRGWAAAHDNFTYTPVLSASEDDAAWQGRKGWVHEAVLADHPDLSAFEAYMSGPPPMIQAGKAAFLTAGLAEDALFFDSFDYSADAQQAMQKA